jgi:hypothetical protein
MRACSGCAILTQHYTKRPQRITVSVVWSAVLMRKGFQMPHSSAENQIIAAVRSSAAASLASGIIAASGRPWSVGQAMGLLTDVSFAMHPVPGEGHYEAWKAKKDERLNTLHS